MSILKTLQVEVDAPKCRETLKDYKSDQNYLKMLKVANFCYRARPSICDIVKKYTPLQVFFN